MKLTAQTVKHAKPGQRLGDGNNLFLQVTQAGVASWVFRYQRNGREHWAGLGPTRDVSLAEARDAAREARRGLRQGIDPIADRRRQDTAVSFREVAEHLIAAKFAGRWAKQWRSTLGHYVYPYIGDLRV